MLAQTPDQTGLSSCGFSRGLWWDQARDTAVVTSWVDHEKRERGATARECVRHSVSVEYWWWCAGGKVVGEDGQWAGEVVLLGKVKGIREWLTDGVEQLSCQSLTHVCSTDLHVTRPYFLIVFYCR